MIIGGVSRWLSRRGAANDDRSNAVLVYPRSPGTAASGARWPPGHPTAGWWDAAHRPRPRAIDTPTGGTWCASTSSAGCQGTTGPASPAPVDDHWPWGSRSSVVSIRDMVRVQKAVADHLRNPPVGVGDRRVDGRHAGARVGGDVARSGCARSCPSPPAWPPPPSRSAGGPPAVASSTSTPSGGAATTTTPPAGDGPREGLALGPDGEPDHLPVRRRVHRPVRRATSSSRSAAASTCGSGSRSSATSSTTATSWCGASTPTATCCSPRPWTSSDLGRRAGRHRPGGRRFGAVPGGSVLSMGVSSDVLYPAYQ